MTEDDQLVGVEEPLRTNLLKRGYAELTRVQQAVLDHGLENVDLRITSETGSGKTVALGMVIAHRWQSEPSAIAEGPRALVITPTRELAMQVQLELGWLFRGLPKAEVAVVTGGTNIIMERRQLARKPYVLVGTPGRLHDHIRSGALNCTSMTQVVLDEADQMLDMGFRDDLDAILTHTPEDRRTHLVSATFPPAVASLAARYQKQVHHVQGTQLGAANSDIEHVAHLMHPQQRFAALVNLLLLAQGERTLVFVRTRNDATMLAEQLSGEGFSALPLSGELPQAQRTRTLNAFRSGAIGALIATDVAARGLDVPNISSVVHFEPPTDPDIYTHRSGRTGRAGCVGRSIQFVPVQAHNRVRWLLKAARIEAKWLPVPSAQQVLKATRKASRRLLHERLTSDESGWTEHKEYAQRLLEEQDPVRLVATLLASTSNELPTQPREIAPVELRDDRRPNQPARFRRGPTPHDHPRFQHGPRPRSDEGPPRGAWQARTNAPEVNRPAEPQAAATPAKWIPRPKRTVAGPAEAQRIVHKRPHLGKRPKP